VSHVLLPVRRARPRRAVTLRAAAAALVLASVGGCNIFENVVTLVDICTTNEDCAAGEICEGCFGDASCVGTCLPIGLRERKFLDDEFKDAGLPDDEDAGVFDAGPPPGPAVLAFVVYDDDPNVPTETVDYGYKPGIRFRTRGMASCEVFMPGEDLVGYLDYAPVVNAVDDDLLPNDEDDYGLLRPSTVTLTCVEEDDGSGSPMVHTRMASIGVTCRESDAPVAGGDLVINLATPPLRRPGTFCRRWGGSVTLTYDPDAPQPVPDGGVLDAGELDDGGAPIETVAIPFDEQLERVLADVIAIEGALIIDDLGDYEAVVGLRPPEGGIAVQRVGGGLALINNAALTDLSELAGMPIGGDGVVEYIPNVPEAFSLMIRNNAALVSLGEVTLEANPTSHVIIRDNPELNHNASLVSGVVGGAIDILDNPKLSSLALIGDVSSAHRLQVHDLPVEVTTISLQNLESLGPPVPPTDQVLIIENNRAPTLSLPALQLIDGDIRARNVGAGPELDVFAVGGGGTSWTGDYIFLTGSDNAEQDACVRIVHQWILTTAPGDLTREGTFGIIPDLLAHCPDP
jgi:hypothetical protein